MYFAMLPPEINSGRMYTGPGSGPMLAAAWAWDGLAADLYSTAISYSSVISGLAGEWLGPSSTSMARVNRGIRSVEPTSVIRSAIPELVDSLYRGRRDHQIGYYGGDGRGQVRHGG
jgi:hypothetical protein